MNMPAYKWILIIGNIVVVLGLICALVSAHYNSKVMGKAALGVAILAPQEGSSEWKKKERLRKIADALYYFGLAFALTGATISTVGIIKSP